MAQNNVIIPPWLSGRLIAAGSDNGPRYESSLYGPVLNLLTLHFPTTERYMVKPQPKIRPEYVAELNDDDEEGELVRSSLDSYRSEVRPKGHSPESFVVPDFIVVKPTASLYDDKVLLIVEVKPASADVLEAKEQIGNYLDTMMDKTVFGTNDPLSQCLLGLLIIGKYAITVSLTKGDHQIGYSDMYFLTGGHIHTWLRNLALLGSTM
jgi:hypothetical protein